MATKSRADKLKKLEMPKKSAGESAADMDLEALMDGSDGNVGAMGAEHPEVSEAENEMEIGQHGGAGDELGHISDDELLAELKSRGLMAKGSPVGKAAEADMVDESALDDSESEPEMPAPKKKSAPAKY